MTAVAIVRGGVVRDSLSLLSRDVDLRCSSSSHAKTLTSRSGSDDRRRAFAPDNFRAPSVIPPHSNQPSWPVPRLFLSPAIAIEVSSCAIVHSVLVDQQHNPLPLHDEDAIRRRDDLPFELTYPTLSNMADVGRKRTLDGEAPANTRKKLRPSELPLSQAKRSAIDSLVHTFRKKGQYDSIRKELMAQYQSGVRDIICRTRYSIMLINVETACQR